MSVGEEKIYVKGKRSIDTDLRNGQPVRDDDRRMFVAMTST